MAQSIKDLHKKVLKRIDELDDFYKYMETVMFSLMSGSAVRCLRNEHEDGEVGYYRYLPALVDVIKANQAVEFGTHEGRASVLLAENIGEMVYTVDISPGAGAGILDYTKITPLIGNSHDKRLFDGVDLDKTDIWFFDSLHTPSHLQGELDIYSPHFKKGAILLFDDIHSFGLDSAWDDLPYEKLDITDVGHHSGFGIARV